ncbi:hypothetical protein HaLaN_30527, partial [Haematococcus lacustris]
MLMPVFEDPNNQVLVAKLQELGSINLRGDKNTIGAHSMQLAVSMQEHYSNSGKVGVHFIKLDSRVLHGVCKQLGLTKGTERHGRAKQLMVFFGAAGIGTGGGWGADAVLRACCNVLHQAQQQQDQQQLQQDQLQQQWEQQLWHHQQQGQVGHGQQPQGHGQQPQGHGQQPQGQVWQYQQLQQLGSNSDALDSALQTLLDFESSKGLAASRAGAVLGALQVSAASAAAAQQLLAQHVHAA